MAEGRGFLLSGVCQDLSFKVIYSRMEMCRPHVHAEGQDGGKGRDVHLCWVALVCLGLSWAHHHLILPSCCAFEGGFFYLWNICLPASEHRCPGNRAQGLYFLQVRAVPGSEIGKIKGRKERRVVGKMDGKRKKGRTEGGGEIKSPPPPTSLRGVRARVL